MQCKDKMADFNVAFSKKEYLILEAQSWIFLIGLTVKWKHFLLLFWCFHSFVYKDKILLGYDRHFVDW